MSLARTTRDTVYRFYLASPRAFEDWTDPQLSELNANPTNDPNGLIWNLTCALSTDGSTFDLGDPELDDSLSFCQKAGDTFRMAENPEIVFEIFRSRDKWTDAASTLSSAGFNSANLAMSLLAWRDVEYFAIMSFGKDEDELFAENDRIKMARVATDWGVDVIGTGEPVRMSNDFANRGGTELLWNHVLTA
jgi:hypothetical protein